MIAYLKGELVVRSEEYIIIEVQGIGYKVFMSKKSIDELQENRQVRVYTYLKVREDDISLFGFNTNEELHMFELLISVGGICNNNTFKYYTIKICTCSNYKWSKYFKKIARNRT